VLQFIFAWRNSSAAVGSSSAPQFLQGMSMSCASTRHCHNVTDEPSSVEVKAREQTLAAHNGAQAGATTRARMVTTHKPAPASLSYRLGVAKLIIYFTLRRHIARVNRLGEGAVHHGQLPSGRINASPFVYHHFACERAVDVRGVSRSEIIQ